jgi:methionine salvage enolase-phosphatase E1
MFKTARQGPIDGLVSRFFSTSNIGKKENPSSYARIAHLLRVHTSGMLYLSDSLLELEAAGKAGCPVVLAERPGNKPTGRHSYGTITSFEQLVS